MEKLETPFTIEIDGKPVAAVGENAEDGIHAQLGTEAAIFTLSSGQLISGDWILGRSLMEDRSMGPKKLCWFKSQPEAAQKLHAVSALEDDKSQKLQFGGGGMIAEGNGVFVDLLGENRAIVKKVAK
ncbi:unnamed protein product [Periconia digitata]|uniref:Uncharacterized protein n=1 Tax=Periconia digitata TaxID=1303443 RepID=A0A9W4U1E3_9PLEO|nr:unnamed protein product [Periconia digitata]